MQTVDLEQGSPEWHAHRLTHFNASDAPAMMGCSPYETRNELIKRLATGIKPEVDAGTQRRFDEGHRSEALARALAEVHVGDDLYPQVGTLGRLSASFDGLTMDEGTNWEHKMLNDAIRAALPHGEDTSGDALPLMYRIQMDQQMLVSGAGITLFHSTKWIGDELVEERYCWYMPDLDLREKIVAGWEQLEADVAAYVPTETAVAVIARPTLGLPAVSIQVSGSIALIDNLDVFGVALRAYIEKFTFEPQTDQDFADLDAAAKTYKKAEEALQSAEDNALAQTAGVDAMRKTCALYRDLCKVNRLLAEKAVKTKKETRRAEIVQAARAAFESHVAELDASIGKPYMPMIGVDFGGAVKGLKSIDSMQNAVDTLLAKSKISANALCADIRKNLATLRADAKGYEPLFADISALVLKSPDDLFAVIATRISVQKAKDAAKAEADRIAEAARTAAAIEAETVRIREEERIKAEAKAAADLKAAQPVPEPTPAPAPQPRTGQTMRQQAIPSLARPAGSAATAPAKPTRPTDVQIVETLALYYRVHESKVVEWLTAMDLQALSDSLETEFA